MEVKLTIIVNNIDNCSISHVLDTVFQTRNEIGLSWSEPQQNSVLVLQSDFIIQSEETNISRRISIIACDSYWCQCLKVRNTYRERYKEVRTPYVADVVDATNLQCQQLQL